MTRDHAAAQLRRLPWTGTLACAMWGFSMLVLLGGLAVDGPNEVFLLEAPVAVAFSSLGCFLALRRPEVVIGWLLAAWGLVITLVDFASAYVERGQADPGSLPGIEWAGWLSATIWHPAFGLLVFMLLLFPDGRLPSPGWRRFAILTVVVYAALAVATALSPRAMEIYFTDLESPLPIPDYEVLAAIQGSLLVGQLLLLATAATALYLRLRRARGTERRQIQLFVYSVILAVTTFVASIAVLGAGYLFPIFGIIPVASAVAILKHGLYDIDRILNRTLVYGLLSAVLAALYFGLVVGLQALLAPLSGGSDLAIALTTLAVAALFLPARSRIQAIVDRRFNRRAYDAALTLEAFSSRLREEIDLDTLRYELLAVLDETMQPVGASLWLRSQEAR